MTTEAPKPLRADAARNFDRIVRAAREIYAERGPDAQLDEIARHAGVGNATLYRHFPDKTVLVRAAVDQAFDEEIAPAIEQALSDDDPRRGLVTVLEATLSMAAREHSTLAAARNAGAMTAEAGSRSFESLILLARRAQQAGLIRADLVPDDMPRIVVMLVSLLWTMDPHSDGRQRYLALVLDALSPDAASPLPAAAPPLRLPGHWPL
ncbi:TetR/AcrR family transcriptional regulator [Nonomuraea guangzhouensis]|uniref:TetR/AcrR family transcriptional regulator n=1 Tax=Nonomuraea guangzhouensis TaxID=1291555 RepID=A0ABW4FZ84_9ACTN|nr:helix-turn-helix domain-containing protein [Nonomuraea guangzhouensis]